MIITSKPNCKAGEIKINAPFDNEMLSNITLQSDTSVITVSYTTYQQIGEFFIDTVLFIIHLTDNNIYLDAVCDLYADDERYSQCDFDINDVAEFTVSMSNEEKIALLLAILRQRQADKTL